MSPSIVQWYVLAKPPSVSTAEKVEAKILRTRLRESQLTERGRGGGGMSYRTRTV